MSQYERLVDVLTRVPEAVAIRAEEHLQKVSASIKQQATHQNPMLEEVERPHDVKTPIDEVAQQNQEPEQLVVDLTFQSKDVGSQQDNPELHNSQIVHKPVIVKRLVDEQSDTSRNMSKSRHEYRIVNNVVDYSLANPEHPQNHVTTTIRSRKQPKPPKLQQIETKRKNLLGQLSKLESELQEITAAKDTINSADFNINDPSMKALELVRKMNEERKRREERVRVETERIKRARAERQETERKRLQQLERLQQIRKQQQQAEERKRQQQLTLRRQKRQAQEIRQIAQAIVKEIVTVSVGEQQGFSESRGKTTNTSSVFVLSRNQQRSERILEAASSQVTQSGRSKGRPDPSNRLSNNHKKEYPEINLKLDKKKHYYPTNKFREQILQEERHRKELQRQLEDQRRKVVDLRRLHNLPPIRPRDLQSLDVQNVSLNNSSVRQSHRYGASRVLLKKDGSQPIESISNMQTITLRTEEAEVQKDQQPEAEKKVQDEEVQYQPPEMQELPKHPEPELKDEGVQSQLDPIPPVTHQLGQKRLATNESQLSQQFEMQFFKSSNPVIQQRPSQPSVEPPNNDDQIRFYKVFDYEFTDDENSIMKQMAINRLAQKGQTLDQQQFDFDF